MYDHRKSRIAKLSASAALALSFALSSGVSAGVDGLNDRFHNPPPAAGPWIRWWWPGDAVDSQEIRREIDVLKSTGFAGGEVIAFNPGIPGLPKDVNDRINAYATPDFFAHLAVAADEAKKQGIHIDYTLGTGYPYGGGTAITPNLALSELAMSQTTVQGPTKKPIQLTIPARSPKLGALMGLFKNLPPGWDKQVEANQKIVAVIAVKGTAPVLKPSLGGSFLKTAPWSQVATPGALQRGTTVILTNKMRPDGTLAWKVPAGEWQIFVFKQNVADTPVAGGVGTGPQFVLDHLNKAAFLAHVERVGGAGSEAEPYFGNGERATFIDSLELMPDLYWRSDFLDQFKKRRGYDLTPYLPLIVQPGWMQAWGAYYSPPYYQMDDVGDRVRADYHRTVSELIIENFWQPVVDWSHEHHLLSRGQPMGTPGDFLKAAGLLDIPETEDLGTGGNPDAMKMARSAADIYGHDLVSAESFCWIGKPFSTTPQMIKRRADLLFASGINEIVAHGFTYKFQADKWPGWYAFMPLGGFSPGFSSMLNEANPLWTVMPSLTSYIARVQAVLQTTRNVVPVAVFVTDPTFSPGPDSPYPFVRDLVPAGYDFDYVNDDGLMKSSIVDGQLVTPGGTHFSALVLPKVSAMRADTAEKIAEFAKQGLSVIFVGGTPQRDEGLLDYRTRDARVKAAVSHALSSGARLFATGSVVEALRSQGTKPNLTFKDGAQAPFIEKADGAGRIFFFYNDRDTPRPVEFTTAAPDAAQLWNTWTGELSSLRTAKTREGVHVALTLQPNESVFVVFGKPAQADTSSAVEQASMPETVATIPVESRWDVSASGHGEKGRVVAFTSRLDALTDWKDIAGMADLSGTAVYETTVTMKSGTPGTRVLLDLGSVHDAATVTVNGKRYSPLLFGPYAVDITDSVRSGRNSIVVEVVNSPQNAMVAGAPKSGERVAAGLVGPVELRVVKPAVAGMTAVPLYKEGPAPARAAYTLDTPLGTLLSDPKARAVIQKYLPDLANTQQDSSATNMSLKQMQPYASSVLTDEVLKKIETDLAAINSSAPAGK